jgi:hypothetical protein
MCQKGWNIMYGYYDDRVEKITTQKPAGVNLQWHYWGLGCWNNNPKPAKLFPFHLDKSETIK